MEHACAKCGSPVEDGQPFCPQCRAPQVRVLVSPQASESHAGTLAGSSCPDVSDTPLPLRIGELDRRRAVRAAIQAGLVGLLLSMLPFLGIVLTGALAVFLYRRAGGSALSARTASRLGAAAGTVTFAISAFLMTVRIIVFHAQQEYRDMMMKVAQAFGLDPQGPDVQEMIHMIMTPKGLALTLLFSFVIGVALAAIGGAVAASLGRRRA